MLPLGLLRATRKLAKIDYGTATYLGTFDMGATNLKKAARILAQEGPVTFLRKASNFLWNHPRLGLRARHSYPIQFAHWLRRGKLLRVRDGRYVLTSLRGSETFHATYVTELEKSTEDYRTGYEQGYFSEEFFVPIEPTDVVVEVGSCIGGTTNIAAERAEWVYAIEPVPTNRDCLRRNVADFDNVTILPYAVGAESGTERIDVAINPAKSSFFGATGSHDRETVATEEVDVKTLEQISHEYDIESIDFLKIEAEGGEPEVLEGIGDAEVRKMVVNCSDERPGVSLKNEITSTLDDLGFDTYEPDDSMMVYAKRD